VGDIAPKAESYTRIAVDRGQPGLMTPSAFADYTPLMLGLGDISRESKPYHAICAVYDLQGFTAFCQQIDPQLAVPQYLSRFLRWIFKAIRDETVRKVGGQGISLWHELPDCTKFLGDGLLLIWDTSGMELHHQHNLIIPLAQGGSNALPNLRAWWTECHGKGRELITNYELQVGERRYSYRRPYNRWVQGRTI